MSYAVAAGKPATAMLRQVMNTGRSKRAPSRAAASTKPRQRLHANSRHQTTPSYGPRDPSSETRSQHAPRRALRKREPFGPAPWLVRRALASRCVAGDASGRHLQPTFQRRAPRFRSATTIARRERGDSRRSTHFVQQGPPPWSPVRRTWRWKCCDSGASVTNRHAGTTAARRLAKTAFPAAP
jgi:hypothetical protein